MTDHTDDRLEAILQSVMWGDYQRPDGRWGRGVGNRDAIKQAIRQLIREEQADAVYALHTSIMDSKLRLGIETDQAFNYARIHRWIDQESAALRQEKPQYNNKHEHNHPDPKPQRPRRRSLRTERYTNGEGTPRLTG